jgi:LacI family transcriptional regulator
MKKTSIQDIATALGISKSTVSLVLNGRGDEKRIKKETQEKIIEYARSVNYSPNALARGLSRGKSETIGLIVPDIADHFYARIAHQIEVKANSYGYQVVYSSSLEQPDLESKLIDTMWSRQVEGLIIASTQHNQRDIRQLQNSNFPFVLIDRHYPEIDTNYVIVENARGVHSAVNHLFKMGKKHIAFVTLKSDLEAMLQRLKGYQKGLTDLQLPKKKEWVCAVSYQSTTSELETGLKEMLKHSKEIDAIIFATHYLATNGLRILRKMNLDIPNDLAVLSFDDIDAFDLIQPAITSIAQPVNQIGNLATDILFEQLKGAKLNQQHILPTQLLIRESCGEKGINNISN